MRKTNPNIAYQRAIGTFGPDRYFPVKVPANIKVGDKISLHTWRSFEAQEVVGVSKYIISTRGQSGYTITLLRQAPRNLDEVCQRTIQSSGRASRLIKRIANVS